jgi:hypothetical protein
MLTGRSFKLGVATLAVVDVNGKRRSVKIPAGAILKVVADGADSPNALVDVEVEGRILAMFAEDVRSRGDEIAKDGATAA